VWISLYQFSWNSPSLDISLYRNASSRTKGVEKAGRMSWTPLSKASLSLHQFSPYLKLLCSIMWRLHGFRWRSGFSRNTHTLDDFCTELLYRIWWKNLIKCLAADTTSRTDVGSALHTLVWCNESQSCWRLLTAGWRIIASGRWTFWDVSLGLTYWGSTRNDQDLTQYSAR